jgi:uncharacterized repeat protein (TIGR01451 family)
VSPPSATGGATCGGTTDYIIESGTLQFAVGQDEQSVSVTVCGDAVVEGNETFRVRLSNASGATIEDATGTVTLTYDDAAAPTPALSINDVSAPEGNTGTTARQFNVTLSAASSQAVGVQFAFAATPTNPAERGAACGAGIDVAVAASGTLTFSPSATSQAIPFTVCGDVVDESDETFDVVLSNPVGATIADGTGRGTITDEDLATAPAAELSIDDLSFPEGNAGNTQNAIVRLSAPSSQAITVLVGARPGGTAAEGACAAGRDVTFGLRTVTINPGQPQISVPFTLCGDTAQEPDESFSLGLTSPVNATLGDSIGQVTIQNDDAPEPLNVSIRDASFFEGNANSTKLVRVSLSATTNQPVTVLVGARPGGTATEGSCPGRDATFAFRSVTINAGQPFLDVPLTVCGDTVSEPDETLSVGLTGAVNAVLGDSIGQVTIRNDDAATVQPPPSLPNLRVAIDQSAQFATQVGPPLVHVVTVTNTGAAPASNVLVQSTLPKGVRFVRVEASQFSGCTGVATDVATGQALVRCTVASLPAGASRLVRIVGEVTGTIADGARVVFGVNADPDRSVPETSEADNFAFLSTIVRFPADLRIANVDLDTLDISRPFGGIGSIIEGNGADFTFHYQWTVTNNGPPASPPTTLRIQWPTAGIQVFGGDGNVIPLTEEVPIPALVPNGSSVVARTVILRTVTGEPRVASVSATADPDHVFDSFVSNNAFTVLVSLK